MPDDKTTADAPAAPKAKKNGPKAPPPAPARKLGLPRMKILQARLKQEGDRRAARK